VPKPLVYLGLGGNLGNVDQTFYQALKQLALIPGNDVAVISNFYQTQPVSDLPQPPYLNAVCRFRTSLLPHELLYQLQGIQRHSGQLPKPKNAPRKIDLDILFYGNQVIETLDLEVPHPRWRERLFVLVPLADLIEIIIEARSGEQIVLKEEIKRHSDLQYALMGETA
jgi:2-amino-4-hydroxy-6-hydroxymethyldihydropteridine diphosphokinase